jgi:hypothetical protein
VGTFVAPHAQLSSIPVFATASDRDSATDWDPGSLVYSADVGYAYFDGQGWHYFGVALRELGYGTTDADVPVAAGATVTIVSAAVALEQATELLLRINLPSLELTQTSGGEVELSAVIAGTGYPIARMKSDRAFGWPAFMSREILGPPAATSIDIQAQSISGPCVVHGGDPYGQISLRVFG